MGFGVTRQVHVSRSGPDRFLAGTHMYLPAATMDVEAMRAAAQQLLGTQDFTAFTNADRSRW